VPVELKIERVAHGGVFVARPEGKVVFVESVLPGEIVEAEIIDEKSSFLRAVPTRIIEASPDRQEHIWPDSLKGAGGADFGHIQLDYQRQLKTEVLREALQRFAKIESSVSVAAVDETDGLHYRTRIQVHYDDRANAAVKRVRSEDLVAIRSMPLADKELEARAIKNPAKYKNSRISYAIDSFGNIATSGENQLNPLSQIVGKRVFEISPEVFWQAHRAAPEVLANEVLSRVRNLDVTEVTDLYSGVGLFAASIAEQFPACKVTAVELNKKAVTDGKRSAKDLKNLRFEISDVLVYLRAQTQPLSTVILDPPRSGAKSKVLGQVARLSAENIIYVACDPVAAARDIQQLNDLGYSLIEISAFDIFPHAHHFETVVSFQRKR
jgi:tRNA/tmRNA/rRNA uracil-C5-methylase (TrmA/RlmC/RlmD family)